ncbi:MAG: ABC transporter ATP-binding protein [Pyrinomonadaceae bacterium]
MLKNLQEKTKYFKYWKRAFGLVWRSAPTHTSFWALFLILQGILPVLTVYLTKLVIDGIVAAKNSGGDWPRVSRAIFYLALMGLVLLVTEAVKQLSAWVRTAQAESVSDHLADKIHKQAAELDFAYYESAEYHDLMEQARGDSSSKPLALLESIGAVVQNIITVVAFAGILITYGWWLPLVLLAGTLPALYVTLRTDRIYHRWWKSKSDDRRWANYYDAMLTHSNAAAEMRLFGLSKYFRTLYQAKRSGLREEKLKHLRRQGIGKLLAGSFALLAAVGAIGWMAVRVLYNLASLGDLGVFYQIFSRGQTLMGALLGNVGSTANNSLYLENLFTFLDLGSKVVSPADPHPIFSTIEKGINFKSVTFCYPDSTAPALSDFNLFIPADGVVALVGVNGAGKSTLIKLLSRFYDPTEGAIEIDGVDLRRFDVRELRQKLSVLFQFPMHYHSPAGENIALGNVEKPVDDKEVTTAARRAGAHDFIMRLPEQYRTLLGKWFVNGTELSGGEWQRLALARAYYRQAPVVVLDEPTSFMDSWSEADWFDRFRRMVSGKTGIVITHRFTIAMRADVIHVIDGGQVLESGTHRELLKKDGFYADSWKKQMQAAGEFEPRMDNHPPNAGDSKIFT